MLLTGVRRVATNSEGVPASPAEGQADVCAAQCRTPRGRVRGAGHQAQRHQHG